MSITWKYERAREILKEEGRTMAWLARRVGTSPGYISHLLTGKKPPSLSLLKLIALELETTEAYLMGTSEERHRKQYLVAR